MDPRGSRVAACGWPQPEETTSQLAVLVFLCARGCGQPQLPPLRPPCGALRHFALAGDILPRPPPAPSNHRCAKRDGHLLSMNRHQSTRLLSHTSKLRHPPCLMNHTARCCQALLAFSLPFGLTPAAPCVCFLFHVISFVMLSCTCDISVFEQPEILTMWFLLFCCLLFLLFLPPEQVCLKTCYSC